MRLVVVILLALLLSQTAFAQEETPPLSGDQPATDQSMPADQSAPDDQSAPADQSAPTGPVLQPADYSPVVCDPNTAGFRYLEVRGTGFDAYATQHLVGNVADAGGVPKIAWSSIWVSPQGRLTLEVNLCADPIQKRPALDPGDYTVSVGNAGGSIAVTGISVTVPPEPGDQTSPDLQVTPATSSNATPTATPFTYVIPTLPPQPGSTPLPVSALAMPTATAGPRTGPGSLQQPYPQGAPGLLVDGWQLVITGVTPDAFKGIQTDVPSATAPASDQRDYMVRVQATYQGAGTGVFSGARLALLNTATGRKYDQIYNSCGVIPQPVTPSVVTAGETVRGNVCFTVRASDIGSLVLLDNQPSDADKLYFALQ